MLRSFWSFRPQARQQRRVLPCEVQQLEVRTVPTGVVTLAQTASGLNITGDVQSNRIQIDVLSTGTTIRAIDNDTVIRVGKVSYPAGTTLPIDTDATFLGNLTFDMKGGDDILVVNVGSIESEPPPVILGGGPNVVLGDFAESLVQGNLSITMGAGNDEVALDVANGHFTVTGNATVDLGSGDDLLVAAPLNEIVNSGNGLDGLGFLGLGGFGDVPEDINTIHDFVHFYVSELGGVEVKGNLKVIAGAGNDGVGMFGVETGRDINVDLGAGHDLFGAAVIGAGRNLDLNAGSGDDDAVLFFAAAGGKTTLKMGAGNDILLAFFLESNRDISVDMGAGDDVLLIGLLLPGPNAITTLDGGSGTDAIATEFFGGGEGLVGADIAPRTTVKNFESDVISNDLLDQLGQDFQDVFFRIE